MGQREGLLQPQEQRVSNELWPLLRQSLYEEALLLFRQHYATTLEDMEEGRAHGPQTDGGDLSAAMFYLIGHTYRSLDQPLPAETAFESALLHLPDYARVHESLGMLYLAEARYEDARPHLARAAELGLNTAGLFGSLGFLNQETDNPWGAVSAYQQALMLDGANSQWQQGLLYALTQSRNYASGLALVEQLLQTYESDADLWVFRAHMAQMTGDDETALASLETAIRLGHNGVSNLQVCATLHMEIGSVDRATELLMMGFVAGMDYQYVDQALRWLIHQDEWENAELLANGVQSGLDDLGVVQRSRLLTHLAGIALNNGQTDDARDSLREALALDAANADALMELAALEKSGGEYGQAELLYQRASAYESHRENALLALAVLAIDQSRYERALELLREIIDRNPGRVDLSRNIEILENLVQLGRGA